MIDSNLLLRLLLGVYFDNLFDMDLGNEARLTISVKEKLYIFNVSEHTTYNFIQMQN